MFFGSVKIIFFIVHSVLSTIQEGDPLSPPEGEAAHRIHTPLTPLFSESFN
jgi:hypothetical protein